ncbi:MAG: hypothetical protein AB1349_06610 [Elusimicrobiota bacterium]
MFYRKLAISYLICILFACVSVAEITDDSILDMVDISLKGLPEKIAKLKPEIRRIAFYSLKVDRRNVSPPLFRQIQGKIESAFLQLTKPILVYTPEVKPLKVVSKKDSISFTTGFQTTDEIKEISQKLKLDGFLEGELFVTANNVYLNLRIFEADSMAIAWSEEVKCVADLTKLELEPPKPKLTGVDWGFGISGIQLGETATTGMSVPQYANYYTTDLRISQKTTAGEKTRFTITAGFLCLYSGASTSTVTMVSSKKLGPLGIFGRLGVRVSLIPVDTKEGLRRDWLATEISAGKIFGSGMGTTGLTVFGLRLESDITKNVSVAAGISIVPVTNIAVGKTSNIKAGSLSYEISLLRFNYMP